MATLEGLLTNFVFTGITGNTAYDVVKGAWTKARQKSWEDLFLDAFEAAVEDVRPRRAAYTEEGEIQLDRAALSRVLHQDLGAHVESLPFSTLSGDQFAAELAKVMAAQSVLIVGGHNLTPDDYAQLVRNLVNHTKSLFKAAILSDEAAFRKALLEETVMNQALTRDVQRILADRFDMAFDSLGMIERKIDAQTDLTRALVAKLEDSKQTPHKRAADGTAITEYRKLIRIFVASPSDVRTERDELHRVVAQLNEPGGLAAQYGCTLQVLDWRDVVAGMGRPEDVILEQLPVESWDVFIGILWKRFGTPSGGGDATTGRYYDSGTQEEFWRAYHTWTRAGRPHILFYRRMSPLPPDVDLEQLAQVRAFWHEFDVTRDHPGLYQDYGAVSDFADRVRSDLIKLLPQLVTRRVDHAPEPIAAPKPGGVRARRMAAADQGSTGEQAKPGLATVAEPPTGSRPGLPPKSYSQLIGRGDELDTVVAALRDEERRHIVVIVGLGGIGKTTLAREAVDRCAQARSFDHVVWASAKPERFVGEGTVRTGVSDYTFDDLLGDIGRQCGRPDSAAMPPDQKQAAVSYLLSNQRVLVVMDNLETVTETDRLVDALYQMRGKSKLLITSRHHVKHDQVFTLNLGGFNEEDGVAFLRYDSKERGIQDVAGVPRDRLVEINQVTGGAPLAMKLVVGQISRQPLEVVLSTLKEASFTGQDYEFYRFVYRHTWDLLDDNGRTALVDMSVFPPIEGGTTTDVAAISHLEPPAFWPAMDQLVTMSLVDKVGTIGNERFALHPLTQYFILADITQEWDNA